MSDKTVKANPDYTNSAEKLTQSPEVKALLGTLSAANQAVTRFGKEWDEIAEAHPVYAAYKDAINIASDATKVLKASIDTYGGYQDILIGRYALKMISYSTTYLIPKIKEHIKDFADKIIIEAVNEKALKGLVKGELVTKEQLALCSEKKRKAAPYVIKVM